MISLLVLRYEIGLILILVLTVLVLAVPIDMKSDTGNMSVDQLIQDLKNADPNVRGSAAAALVYLNDTRTSRTIDSGSQR